MKSKKVFREIPLNNPFFRDSKAWDQENENRDKTKIIIVSIFLLPIRVVGLIVSIVGIWSFAHVGLLGCSQDDLKTKPLTGWRR